MVEPSGRPYSLAVLTTTARTTSLFLTAPPGVASLTVPTITSPTLAYSLFPASTRIHMISRAPVLSATRQRVKGRIMTSLAVLLARRPPEFLPGRPEALGPKPSAFHG